MKINTQQIIVLIDHSGSMAGKEQDTIVGINTMLGDLKNDKRDNDQIFVSLKLFDNEVRTIIENKNIDQVELLKINDFKPRGQTALLDSLGITLQETLSKKRTNLLSYNSCLIYVCTDGIENASSYYSKNDIKNLIKICNDENINILYLGANQDSFLEAKSIGINLDAVMNYDQYPDTIRSAFASVAQVASRTRYFATQPIFTHSERQSSQNILLPINVRPPILRRQTDIALSNIPSPIRRSKSYA